MTRFKLAFFSRARLWAEVVVTGGTRVFVATTETPPLGSLVELELELASLEQPIALTGEVVAHRALQLPQPAGLVIKLDEASLERCRSLVADHDENARITGRSEARADCDLPARLLQPTPQAGCTVKSLSVHGLTLHTQSPLSHGAQVGVELTLPDGAALSVQATVRWSRVELSLAGLHIDGLDATAQRRVELAVDVLLGKKAAPVSSARLVVVADDDSSILEFSAKVVTMAGHRVLRAERGDEALELARRERPDLLMLDVLMPGLDGLEVCKAVRGDVALRRMPVILLSAMSEAKLAEAAKMVGASGFLTKPMRLEALRATLAQHLARG